MIIFADYLLYTENEVRIYHSIDSRTQFYDYWTQEFQKFHNIIVYIIESSYNRRLITESPL